MTAKKKKPAGKPKTTKKKTKTRKPKMTAARRKKVGLIISRKLQLRKINQRLDEIESGRMQGKPEDLKKEYNKLLNKAVDLNTDVTNIQEKLGTGKKNSFRTGAKGSRVVLSKVWEKQKSEDFVFFSGQLNSLNGHSVNNEQSEILDLMNKAYRIMGSDDYIAVYIDDNGKAVLKVVNGKDINDDDFAEDEEDL